jgi:hypothetical protein
MRPTMKPGDLVVHVNDSKKRVVKVLSVDATHATVAGPPVPGSGGQAVPTSIPFAALRLATTEEISDAGAAS